MELLATDFVPTDFHVSREAEDGDLQILEGLFQEKPDLSLRDAATVMEISEEYAKRLFAELGRAETTR